MIIVVYRDHPAFVFFKYWYHDWVHYFWALHGSGRYMNDNDSGEEFDVRSPTRTVSIFGQVQSVIADAMVNEGKAHRIEPQYIPQTVRYDDDGNVAHCALVLSAEAEQEFDERVRNLLA